MAEAFSFDDSIVDDSNIVFEPCVQCSEDLDSQQSITRKRRTSTCSESKVLSYISTHCINIIYSINADGCVIKSH